MAEENERKNRNRKVIPYDQAFGAQNAGLTYSEPEDGDIDSPYPPGFRDLETEDTKTEEVGSPLEAAEPIGKNDRDPEDIRSERDDIESAQEIAEPMPRKSEDERNTEEETNEGNGLGITGLILSLVSVFILPGILAPAGMILGYIAFRRGSRTTGVWAMVVGAFALLMALFILPAYFR
mgnify:CR=1 FL=1